jgi:hypothetical protein
MMTGSNMTVGRRVVTLIIPPAAFTGLIYLTRARPISLFQVGCSVAVLAMAWAAYLSWKEREYRTLPLFAMLALGYWLYYVPALFWGHRRYKPSVPTALIGEAAVSETMLLVVLGVACLWLGMRSGLGRRLIPATVLDIRATESGSWYYTRLVLVAGVLVSYVIRSPLDGLGSGSRQLLMLLSSAVPTMAFALVFRRYLQGRAAAIDGLLIMFFLGGRFLVGMSAGWLGAAVSLVVLCAATFLYERRKLPVAAALILIPFVMFFQVGKEQFRQTFWGARVEAGMVERISFWLGESMSEWSSALEDPSGERWRALADKSLGRLSLLQQTANVLEMTPAVVPYQYGQLYSYLAVTLVPRAIWPGKPSVNDANRFYQVAYGITDERNLEGVSIAVGVLTESYINFGWLGGLLVMVPLGIFFDFFQHTFLSERSGYVFNAIGLALMPLFMSIESQMAQYLGGLVQAIVLIIIIFSPVLHRARRGGLLSPLGQELLWAAPAGRVFAP